MTLFRHIRRNRRHEKSKSQPVIRRCLMLSSEMERKSTYRYSFHTMQCIDMRTTRDNISCKLASSLTCLNKSRTARPLSFIFSVPANSDNSTAEGIDVRNEGGQPFLYRLGKKKGNVTLPVDVLPECVVPSRAKEKVDKGGSSSVSGKRRLV